MKSATHKKLTHIDHYTLCISGIGPIATSRWLRPLMADVDRLKAQYPGKLLWLHNSTTNQVVILK